MDFGLRGKVAFVTGAAGGFGHAIAELLAAEGANVYLADLDERAVASVADEFAGGSASAMSLDVGDQAAVDRAIATVLSRAGRLDIAVNNAGILRTGLLADSTLADWEALSRINVAGVYNCCKAEVAAMSTQRSGKILNLGSVSAFKGGGSVG